MDANKRGVQVQAILDKSQRGAKHISADFVANVGIPITIDASHAIAHNKGICIDGETVVGGSFHYTKVAQKHNVETMPSTRDKTLATQDTQNRETHRQHSQPYVGRGVHP